MDALAIAHKTIVKQKLEDRQMRENLAAAMHTMQANRQRTIQSKFIDWEGLRERGRQIKDETLNSLGQMLETFERQAVSNGMQVHYASTSEDACTIVYELMRSRGIDRVLKGKSMATEEIKLNHFLQERGIDAIETDLGELIIQLNGEMPVHIVGPALHKNRYEVGQIFHEHLGAPLESDIEKLNAIAREHLRSDFARLKMGISGVNFAAASEGALWLIENEGNGRMCTTAPDIHVAVCGIEKLVPSLEDAATLAHLLTPSTTGQLIPAYCNIITGPRKAGEKDGPREVHVILLDNRRSSLLAHRELHEALRCIRCGTCLNFCPVFDKIGGHAYRSIYTGPIGEVITPNIFGIKEHGEMLSLCTQCGRCSEVCPEKIPLARLIRHLRAIRAGQMPGIPQPAQAESAAATAAASAAGQAHSSADTTHSAAIELPASGGAADACPGTDKALPEQKATAQQLSALQAPQLSDDGSKAERMAVELYARAAVNSQLWSMGAASAVMFNSILKPVLPHTPGIKGWARYKELPKLGTLSGLVKKVRDLPDVTVE